MPPQSPLLDDYNQTGIVTPALQRALDIARQKLPQFQLPGQQPTAPTPRFTPPGLQVPSITRTPGAVDTAMPVPSSMLSPAPQLTRSSNSAAAPAPAGLISAPPTSQESRASTYDTPLTAQEEQQFQTWKSKYAPHDSGADYDLRGAFKAGLTPAPNGHWPDTFKKPNHPTFSNQSKYAVGEDASKAGHWEGEGPNAKFVPPGTSSTPMPSVAPAGPMITDPDAPAHLTERDRLIQTGSGISQIHNPVARGLLRGLDVIGSAFAPRITAGIPGTELHHNYLVRQAEGTVDKDVARAKENATTAETEQRATNEGLAAPGQRARTEAEARELNARASEAEQNRPKNLLDLFMRDNPNGTAEDFADFQEKHKPITSEFEAWAKDPANKGKPVSEFMKLRAENATPKEGELPLGENVGQLNKLLAARYQVLNPGKALPQEFTIPANATQKDYDRIDKALEATERAAGTKAQQDEVNALRRQAADAAAEARNERQDREGRRVVTGVEPGTGRTVIGSVDDAKNGKWTGVMDLPAAEQSQAYNARHWLTLAGDTKADPVKDPDKTGVLQLIDALDKRGALGAIASRWNEFLVGKGISTGNDETDRMIEALRTKMGLSNTLLMKVHVGNRGGSFMMEHFEDLANQKKMNANTLRTGVKSEMNYVDHLAGIPSSGQGSQGGGSGNQLPGGISLDDINAELERRKKK